WIRYLRGDFEGAFQSFNQLSEGRGRRRRMVRDDRTVYWSAMSLARLNRGAEAEKLFSELESKDPSSFYSVAARARRGHLPKAVPTGELPMRSLTSVDPKAETPDGGDAPNPAESEEQLSINQEVSADGEAASEESVELTEDNVDSDED